MGISSMPILFGNIFLIIAFVLTFFIFLFRGKKLDRLIIIYSLVFLVLFMFHILAFNQFLYPILIAYYMRIFYGYFTVKIVGPGIDTLIINQMYVFSIISIIITGIFALSPTAIDYAYANLCTLADEITYFQPNRKHFIIYTMELGWNVDFPRNSGPFWEPGGFSVFLYLAFVFNLIKEKSFFNKKNIVFLITLISTQSTTGYLAFFIFGIVYVVVNKRISYSIVLAPILLAAAIFAYTNVDFLGDKIDNMVQDSQKENRKQIYTRVVSGQINLERFFSSPIFGIGRFYEIDDDSNPGNNGTTLLLAEFGLVGFLFYFANMFRSYKNYCIENKFDPKLPIAIIIGWLVLGYSQGLFQKPFFYALSFMFLFDGYAKHTMESKILNFKKKVFPQIAER